ncbi:MAG TPA: hypothetical protein VMT58_01210, partial [Candidatus Binataceae bacterium]|nr:hypothetical protein [Candidatus Binataceae bacterium]
MKIPRILAAAIAAALISAIPGNTIAAGSHGGHAAHAHPAVHHAAVRARTAAAAYRNGHPYRRAPQHAPYRRYGYYRYRRGWRSAWGPYYGWAGTTTIIDEDQHDQFQSVYEDSHSPYLKATEQNPPGPAHTWVVRESKQPAPPNNAPGIPQQ